MHTHPRTPISATIPATAATTGAAPAAASPAGALPGTLTGALRRLTTPTPQRLLQLTLALAIQGALVLSLLPQPAHALADAAAFQQANTSFNQAQGGDESAIAKAAEQWRALSAADPTDPVLRAYAGSAIAMQARSTVLPWKKMGYAEDGLAQLDKALAQLTPAHDAPAYRGVPAVLETRFTAASTFLALPSMFNRQERGARLLDEVLKSPLFEAAPLGFKAAVWLTAGRQAAKAQRTDEARQWLTKAAASNTPAAAAAAEQLKQL